MHYYAFNDEVLVDMCSHQSVRVYFEVCTLANAPPPEVSSIPSFGVTYIITWMSGRGIAKSPDQRRHHEGTQPKVLL